MAFIGNTPTTQSFSPATDYFSGNGSTTAFTLSRPVASVNQVEAVIENVVQNPSDAYTVSGNTITFTSSPPSGTNNIYVRYTSPITQIIAPSQNSVGASQLQNGSVGTAQLQSGSTVTQPTLVNYTEAVVSIGTVTTSNTLSLTNGTFQTATLTASTACTFTMPTVVAGKSFVLLLKQAASTGNGTATFTSVKWGTAGAPTITAAAGKMDILSFVSDGTNWYGSIAQGYTP